jgi:hypothetical protein
MDSVMGRHLHLLGCSDTGLEGHLWPARAAEAITALVCTTGVLHPIIRKWGQTR